MPRPLYPRKTPDTNCIGGWVGPRAGLDGCGNSRPLPVIFCILLYSVLHPYLCLRLDYPAFCLYSLHTTYMPHAEFEPATPATDQPQTLRLRPLGHGDHQHKHPCCRLDSIPGTSSPKSVAISTELSRPILRNHVICNEKLTFQ
jgi:hypothetical protein